MLGDARRPHRLEQVGRDAAGFGGAPHVVAERVRRISHSAMSTSAVRASAREIERRATAITGRRACPRFQSAGTRARPRSRPAHLPIRAGGCARRLDEATVELGVMLGVCGLRGRAPPFPQCDEPLRKITDVSNACGAGLRLLERVGGQQVVGQRRDGLDLRRAGTGGDVRADEDAAGQHVGSPALISWMPSLRRSANSTLAAVAETGIGLEVGISRNGLMPRRRPPRQLWPTIRKRPSPQHTMRLAASRLCSALAGFPDPRSRVRVAPQCLEPNARSGDRPAIASEVVVAVQRARAQDRAVAQRHATTGVPLTGTSGAGRSCRLCDPSAPENRRSGWPPDCRRAAYSMWVPPLPSVDGGSGMGVEGR